MASLLQPIAGPSKKSDSSVGTGTGNQEFPAESHEAEKEDSINNNTELQEIEECFGSDFSFEDEEDDKAISSEQPKALVLSQQSQIVLQNTKKDEAPKLPAMTGFNFSHCSINFHF